MISMLAPSKVVAVIFAPGVPAVLGQMKFAH
jgi:hypothetical protein